MTKVDLLHNLRVKFNELSPREYIIVDEVIKELQGETFIQKHLCMGRGNQKTHTAMTLLEQIHNLEEQITKWEEDYICLENLKDNQIKELQAENRRLENEIMQKCYPEQM